MKTLCLAFGSVFAQPGARFVNGLTRAKMAFSKPDGYTKTTPIDNPHMTYGHAVKNDTAAFEVRYAIRPIDEVISLYKEGKGNAYMFFMGNDADDISFLSSRTEVFTSLKFK